MYDNYRTEIWLDCNSYAANAQYTKSKKDMEQSDSEKIQYRRQEQLKVSHERIAKRLLSVILFARSLRDSLRSFS